MYKAILFDFFGVIQEDPFKKWLKTHGLQDKGSIEEANNLVDLGNISEQEFYERLAQASGQTVEMVRISFRTIDQVDKDVVSLIAGLHTVYKTGLLSNSSKEYLKPILKRQNLTNLFDEIVISAEIGMIKPRLEIFQYILSKMKVNANETIFIDDSQYNVELAKQYGVESILYTDLDNLKARLIELKLAVYIPTYSQSDS